MIVGDFNIHVNDTLSCYAKRFSDLLHQYGFCQYVNEPTHAAGNTIDLIFARECDNLINSVSVHDYSISDHCLVLCKVSYFKGCNNFVHQNVRNWKKLNFDLFGIDLSSSRICNANILNSAKSPLWSFCIMKQCHPSLISMLLSRI